MRPRRAAVGAALAVLAWIAWSGVAAAHDDLVSSSPVDGQSVARSPEKVELEFSGELQSMGEGTALIVTGPGGDVVTGDLEVEGPILRFFLGSVLPTAEYQVAYRVVSTDGHVVTGGTRFFVGPVPAELTTAPPGAPFGVDAPVDDGVPRAVVVGVGVLLVVVVAGLVVRRGRQHPDPS